MNEPVKLRYVKVIWVIWGFPENGGTPKSSKSLDHDLVLKPMATPILETSI